MGRPIGKRLAAMSEQQLCDWTTKMLAEITNQHIEALDLQGWKVVHQDTGRRWMFRASNDGGLSEDEILEWAGDRLCEITDAHTKALDIAGWRIVSKNDDPYGDGYRPQWPFDSKATGCKCPDWCGD